MKDLINNHPELAAIVAEQERLYENAYKTALITAKKNIEPFKEALNLWQAEGKSTDFLSLFKYKVDMKFIRPISQPDQTFLDMEKLHAALLQIEKDDRVVYIYKHAVFALLNFFYDALILGKLLNEQLYKRLKKVDGNRIYFFGRETYLLSKKNSFKKRDLPFLKYNAAHVQFRVTIEELFRNRFTELDNSIPNETPWEYLLTMTRGNNNKIEKLLLPNLMDYIFLNKNFDSSNPQAGASIKRTLLFDLLKNILQYRQFLNQEQFERRNSGQGRFYDGNYSHYKDQTVADIFAPGKTETVKK